MNNFRLNSLSFFFFSLGNFLDFPSLQHRSIKTRPEETRMSLKITEKNYALFQIRIATLYSGKIQQNGKFSHISNALYDAEFISKNAKPTLNNHIKFFCLKTKISQAVPTSQKGKEICPLMKSRNIIHKNISFLFVNLPSPISWPLLRFFLSFFFLFFPLPFFTPTPVSAKAPFHS